MSKRRDLIEAHCFIQDVEQYGREEILAKYARFSPDVRKRIVGRANRGIALIDRAIVKASREMRGS